MIAPKESSVRTGTVRGTCRGTEADVQTEIYWHQPDNNFSYWVCIEIHRRTNDNIKIWQWAATDL
jgi:hypothetical protein